MNKNEKPVAKEPLKEIKETKCTCEACGKTWFYGKADVVENTGKAMKNVSKGLLCCSGCLPALFLRDQEVKDLNKCPQCGSRAVKKETIVHHV